MASVLVPAARTRGELHSSKALEMLDRLAGRLCICDSAEKFYKLAVTALADNISAQWIAWVPADAAESIAVTGDHPAAGDQIRRLIKEAKAGRRGASGRTFVENNVGLTPWGPSFPAIHSVALASADERGTGGHLVAVNSASRDGFRPHDTAIMLPVTSLLKAYRKNLSFYVELKELLFGVVRSLTSAIDAKDRYTRGHSERVARMAMCLGRALGLGADEVSNLYLAGLLHDVGKIGVEDSVLNKPGRLTDSEYRRVMSHVEMGVSILRELKRLRRLLPGILHHHERYAGGGYPAGIAGEEIPLIGRILAVADSLDAMASDRPYRPRRELAEVHEILRAGAGDQWDPKVIAAALDRWPELIAIQQRGLGESLRVAVDDAMHQEYAGRDSAQPDTRSA